MQHIDRNTNPDRLEPLVRPLIQSFLHNRQLFGSDDDGPFLTKALKYDSQRQSRRRTTPYKGNDKFVENIIDIFGFDPLDFQVESWQTVDRLERAQQDDGRTKAAIFSAPTGFGKTEAFLGPLYQLLREERQESVAIVYPSRALLQDQLGRVLEHVHTIRERTGTQLSTGVYVGRMPYEIGDVAGNFRFFDQSATPPRFKLANCWCDDGSHSFEYHGSSSSYELRCERNPEEHRFTDRELVLARQNLVFDNRPDIILTTLESLEGFALKPNYPLVDCIDTIVLDEVHLYTQLRGAHAANVIENVNAASEDPILWLGSSATIDDADRFGKRLFDVSADDIETISPPESDYDDDHDDHEHYYFLLADPDGPGATPMSIQQHMLLGHSLLEDEDGDRSKLLAFIDSISQVNQKRVQLEDADRTRELWRHHSDPDSADNWPRLADEMDQQFIDEPLSFLPVYSDAGFDSDAASESDVLLSTSFLEVGIDVGEIKIVTQYRTPWNLSSFLQRAGRAARQPGMDAHVVVFLSNLTGDANMFYRADRFLGSDIRTPLKTDNRVVEWIHERFRQYYRRASTVRENRHQYISPQTEHLAFLEGYLVDDLGFDRVYHMISEPDAYFEDAFGIDVSSEPLLSEAVIDDVQAALYAHLDELGEGFEDIEGYFDIEGGEVVRGANAIDSYVDEVQEQTLTLIHVFLGQLQGYESVLEHADNQSHEDDIKSLREKFDDLRESAVTGFTGSASERVEQFSYLLADLYQIGSELMRIQTAANAATDRPVTPVKMDELHAVQQAVNQLDALTTDERLTTYYRTQQRIYYLQSALDELKGYVDYRKPYLSLFAVKDLLRAAYYVDRYLRVTDEHLAREVWYVPPNYYGDTGRYVTVFSGKNDHDGSEESVDQLVSTYAPYRSEYQSDSGVMRAFLPKTTVTDDGVEFEFSKGITGEIQDGILVPDTIRTTEITDLTDDRALNIVRYCPECLQILTDVDQCLRHGEREYGKIHSTAHVQTRVTDRETDETTGTLSLTDLTASVSLEGVTLDIKPARPMGPEIGLHFDSRDRFQREISSPETPIGFHLETRGLVFDIEPFLESLDDELREAVAPYKDLDEVDFEHIVYHTAAHFFLQLTADVSSVNSTMLLYGFDYNEQEVYVFERSEGGQGIVDLVYDELRIDPGSVLETVTRLTYNEQVLAERLWATESFVDDIPLDQSDTESVRRTIENHLDVLYDDVVERVEQEVVSTIDHCHQFADDEGIELTDAVQIKHTVAREQVEGTDEFSEEQVEELDIEIDDLDRVETMFYSPDIDGCVENLHLSECISGHDQKDALSYVVLEALRENLLTTVSTADAATKMFDRELPPAGEIDGTSVFLDF